MSAGDSPGPGLFPLRSASSAASKTQSLRRLQRTLVRERGAKCLGESRRSGSWSWFWIGFSLDNLIHEDIRAFEPHQPTREGKFLFLYTNMPKTAEVQQFQLSFAGTRGLAAPIRVACWWHMSWTPRNQRSGGLFRFRGDASMKRKFPPGSRCLGHCSTRLTWNVALQCSASVFVYGHLAAKNSIGRLVAGKPNGKPFVCHPTTSLGTELRGFWTWDFWDRTKGILDGSFAGKLSPGWRGHPILTPTF